MLRVQVWTEDQRDRTNHRLVVPVDQCIFDAEQLALGCLLEESQIGPVCLLLDVFAIYFSYMTIKCENIMR